MRARRRGARLALALALLATVVVWNAVFDRAIGDAVDRYLALQQARIVENRPFVYVQDVMRPAAVDGAIRATVWCLPIVAGGLVAAWWMDRRARRG